MDWEPGLSIWKQIEKQLLADISGGVFAPGDKMPTEMELVRRFGVNRHTVRRAMAALVDSNVVRVEQGRGAFVQEQILDYPLGSKPAFRRLYRVAIACPTNVLFRQKFSRPQRQSHSFWMSNRARG